MNGKPMGEIPRISINSELTKESKKLIKEINSTIDTQLIELDWDEILKPYRAMVRKRDKAIELEFKRALKRRKRKIIGRLNPKRVFYFGYKLIIQDTLGWYIALKGKRVTKIIKDPVIKYTSKYL